MTESEDILELLINLWENEYPKQSVDELYEYHWRKEEILIKDIKFHRPKSIKKAKKYLKLIEDNVEFPPIVILYRKNGGRAFVLIDGYHRIWAFIKAGRVTVPAFIGVPKGSKNFHI